MHYFTYITRLIGSDKYYVGRHTTSKDPSKDKYVGSGKWVRSIKDKELLVRDIIEYYPNEEDLKQAEELLLKEHIGQPGCMNFNERSVGFSSINNPNKTPEARAKLSERVKGINNAMYGKAHTDENKQRLRERNLARPPVSDETRAKISAGVKGKNVGKVRTAELKAFFSKQRKQQFANGRPPNKSFLGKRHTEQHKMYMSELAKSKPNVKCEHCGKEMKKQLYVRWHGDNCKVRNV